MRIRISTILFSGTALVIYLSLRPSPSMAELSWLPPWLAQWADKNGELRTAVPFFMLSSYIGLEACISYPKSRSLPALMWLLGFYGLVALLFLAELLQIPLANRYFTWGDIGWGIIGTLGGCAPVFVRGLFLRPRELPQGDKKDPEHETQ